MKITVKTWDKYNPRKDIRATSWMRLENTFFIDEEMFDLTCEQKCVWLFILCQASRKMSGVIRFNSGQCAVILRVDGEVIADTIDTLVEMGLVTVEGEISQQKQITPVDVTRTSRGRTATNERTNTTNETNERTNNTPARKARVRVDPKFSEWDMGTAELMQEAVIAANPQATQIKKVNLEKWADIFRLMRTVDKIEEEQIEKALNWVFKNDFWRANIQSPGKLRKQWDTITGQMQRKGEQSYGDIANAAAETVIAELGRETNSADL